MPMPSRWATLASGQVVATDYSDPKVVEEEEEEIEEALANHPPTPRE